MQRIDCEKCLHSEFEGEKLRCRLNKCQPEYSDMKEAKLALLEAFPRSFINKRGEFIAHERTNQYFILEGCEYPEDVECKVLEWLSRAASKGMPYRQEQRNRKYRKFIQDGINAFLDTNFSEEDFDRIYTYLGNSCNHPKTLRFVRSGYDFSVLN